MREVMGRRSWLVIAVAMTAILSAEGAATSLGHLVESVVRNGPDAELPAHLSVVLGLSRIEQQTAVKQAVVRDGATVRTFNVCTAGHELVMLTYDEHSRLTQVYLLSAAGVLRKAVRYQAGGAAEDRPLRDARGDFDREIKFWTDFAQHPARPD